MMNHPLRLSATMLLIGISLAFLTLTGTESSLAQDTISCTVEPRSAAEIEALNQQASTGNTPVSQATPAPGVGIPVSDQVAERLQRTLDMVEACTRANDIPRLAALFTDQGAIEYLYGSESVPIVEGTPPASAIPSIGTPASSSMQEEFISEALLLPDGRILATVTLASIDEPTLRIWFKMENGMYRIDQVQSLSTSISVTAVPEESMHDEATDTFTDTAIAVVEQQIEVPAGTAISTSVERVDWPDSSLGCPDEGGVYLPVITPGYRIVVTVGDQTFEFHTDTKSAIVQCDTQADSS